MSFISTPLDDLLSSRTKVRLLRFFAATREPCSGREAARQIGMAKRGVDLALRDLVLSGAVLRKELGGQPLYKINRHHTLVREAIFALFKGEQNALTELFETLKDCVMVESGGEPLWAGLYGSTARGDDLPESDVDFAVVVSNEPDIDPMQTRLSEMAFILRRRFGKVFSPLVITQHQLQRLATAGDPLVESLKNARRVAGKVPEFEKLLHGSH